MPISESLLCNTCERSMRSISYLGRELSTCIECELGLRLAPFDVNEAMDFKFGWWATCEGCGFSMMRVFSVHTKFCDGCFHDLLRFVNCRGQ